MLTSLDAGSMVGAAMVVALTATLSVAARRTGEPAEAVGPALDDVQLLPSDEVDLRHVQVRPGNLLVPVRKPHALAHLSAALDAAGDRDVVVMTGRLIGVDVPDDPGIDTRVDRRRAAVVRRGDARWPSGTAARCGCSSRPASTCSTRSSRRRFGCSRRRFTSANPKCWRPTIRRGCSATPGSGRQGGSRPASGSSSTIHSGRTAAYHLGLTRPRSTLKKSTISIGCGSTSAKAVGPHVHHRDVVHAALTYMEEQLNGPNREATLNGIKETARPAD